MHYSFEHITRLLDIPETVLARLCHVFKLPAAAFTANSRVLVQGNAPFTQSDLDRLSAIHQAIMAGHPLKTIQQRFARQDAVAVRAALPTQPNFLAVLGQKAQQATAPMPAPLPVMGPQTLAPSAAEKPVRAMPPTEAILATLASRIQNTMAKTPMAKNIAKNTTKNITTNTSSSPAQPNDTNVAQGKDLEDLKALFPNALRGSGHITSQLTDVANTAKPTTRPMCPPQTAPTRFNGFPVQPVVAPPFTASHQLIPPVDLQQAFRRRVQPIAKSSANPNVKPNTTVHHSFKAF